VTARVERVAAADAGDALAGAFDSTVFLHGLNEIHTAGRREAAVPAQYGAEHNLIDSDQEDQ
jgi:hypothetical protein